MATFLTELNRARTLAGMEPINEAQAEQIKMRQVLEYVAPGSKGNSNGWKPTHRITKELYAENERIANDYDFEVGTKVKFKKKEDDYVIFEDDIDGDHDNWACSAADWDSCTEKL